MSTRSVTIPDRLTEPVFVLGLVIGSGLLGVGFGMLILGVSVGVVTDRVLTPSEKNIAIAVGIVVAVVGLLVRWWRGRADHEALQTGGLAVGGLGVLVGLGVVVFGVAGLLGLRAPAILESLQLSPRTVLQAAWLAVAVVVSGFVLAAVGVQLARTREHLERDDLELAVWVVGTSILVVGLTALFIGLSSHEGVSSPFFETMRDKAVMIAFGQLLMLAGWAAIRVSGRTVGW